MESRAGEIEEFSEEGERVGEVGERSVLQFRLRLLACVELHRRRRSGDEGRMEIRVRVERGVGGEEAVVGKRRWKMMMVHGEVSV